MVATENERVANAVEWVENGVDASATDLHPNYGPVWVYWNNPNYVGWVEEFETAGHAAEEMFRRIDDHYYPLWVQTEALVYGTNPADDNDAYPLAMFTVAGYDDNDAVVLS